MKHVPLFVLAGLVFVILLAVVVFVWLPESFVFDVKLEAEITEVAAGESLVFTVVLVNPEEVVRQVVLVHELVKDNKVIARKQLSTTMTRTQEVVQVFPIPSNSDEGSYVLRTTVSSDSMERVAELMVHVVKKSLVRGVQRFQKPVLEETEVRIAQPVKEVRHLVEKPRVRVIQEVQEVELENEQDCEQLPVRRRDSCFFQRAQSEQNSAFCEQIIDALIHDSCLFSTGTMECSRFRAALNQEVCLSSLQ